jgi:plastocyanin
MTRQTLSTIVKLIAIACIALFVALPATAAETREFFINTVHIDGKGNIHGDDDHPAEAFPPEKLPEGRGLKLTEPNKDGAWKMRAFAFVPSQIIVNQGDNVRLNFVGVQGRTHTIHVEGKGVDEKFTVTRGHMKTVDIEEVQAGTIEIECYDHEPAMRAEVVVLPNVK